LVFVNEPQCVFLEVASIFLRDTYVKFRSHSVDGSLLFLYVNMSSRHFYCISMLLFLF